MTNPPHATAILPAQIEAACKVLHGEPGWQYISMNNHAYALRERALVLRALAAALGAGAITNG